jgi:hypothetical protein
LVRMTTQMFGLSSSRADMVTVKDFLFKWRNKNGCGGERGGRLGGE